MLLTALPACGRQPVNSASSAPAAVAVDTHTAPPAELLACPERPDGFPTDELATIPEPLRAALMRLAGAFGRNAERQERLIAFETGKPCGAELEGGR